jgi:hypothetical protein
MTAREMRKLVYHAVCKGVDIRLPDGGRHYAVYKDGRRVGSLPYSPSDVRWRQNAIAEIRRATGVDLRTQQRRTRKLAPDAQPDASA